MQVRLRISYPSFARPERLPSDPAKPAEAQTATQAGGSSRVALGILVSRISGFVRESAIAHYFGASGSVVADVFRAAFRIPNLLSNLFGEGVLAASFVPVYSKLRALGDDKEAEHVAAAVLGLLSLLCAALVFIGVLLTPVLIEVIAPGFKQEERVLTIHIVRILFPGAGLLVMSAWCLGILNSHRRFLLSYMAPVAMNATMIAALIAFGASSSKEKLVSNLAWSAVLGSALQFLVQLPKVLEIMPAVRPIFEVSSKHVQAVARSFGPIFLSRGVVQISAYIDSMIASYLPAGSMAILGYGQIISVLPVSLFSMSVSAAELPALSSAVGTDEEVASFLRGRLTSGLRRIAFLVIPSAAAFLILGDVLAGALYQSGRFRHQDALYVWAVLAGSAVGLLATSLGRLYSSAFYALRDTRTPLRFAIVRIVLTTLLGLLFAFPLPHWLGIDVRWSIAGLTTSAGISGWVEFTLLRGALSRKIGRTPVTARLAASLWSIALAGGGAAYLLKRMIGAAGAAHPRPLAVMVLGVYGFIYFGGTYLAGIPECRAIVDSILRRARALGLRGV